VRRKEEAERERRSRQVERATAKAQAALMSLRKIKRQKWRPLKKNAL
jgi:hypothetical protein